MLKIGISLLQTDERIQTSLQINMAMQILSTIHAQQIHTLILMTQMVTMRMIMIFQIKIFLTRYEGFQYFFEERANTNKETITTAINAIFNTDLRFNDQWKVTSQVGLQWEQLDLEQYIGANTFTMRDLRYESRYDNGTKYRIPKVVCTKLQAPQHHRLRGNCKGEWSQSFADIHEVQIMGGSEIRKNWYNSLTSNAYGYDPKTLTTKPVVIRDDQDAKNIHYI